MYIAIPNMLQPGPNILLPREIRHHCVGEFQLDLAVERVDQGILSLEVRKKRSFGDASALGDLGRRGCRETALRKEAGRGVEDCVALVFAFRARQGNPPWVSYNSIIHCLSKAERFLCRNGWQIDMFGHDGGQHLVRWNLRCGQLFRAFHRFPQLNRIDAENWALQDEILCETARMHGLTNSLLDVTELRERLRKMNDTQLARFGKAAQRVCHPSSEEDIRATFAIHLHEARTEWKRRQFGEFDRS
jgi:hypothetical protein